MASEQLVNCSQYDGAAQFGYFGYEETASAMKNPQLPLVSGSIYHSLRESVLSDAQSWSEDQCRIRGAWTLNLACQPTIGERIFRYDVAIVQTQQQGAAYTFAGQIDHSKAIELIGRDARECIPSSMSVYGLAVLDAICGSFDCSPTRRFVLEGLSADKAVQRAQIVADEVARLTLPIRSRSPRVANVGAIGNVVGLLVKAGFKVTITDLDPAIIGRDLHGCTVLDGHLHTESSVHDCDIAVVTGMTLSTGALDGILHAATTGNTKIVLLAETGAWFREHLLKLGVTTIISEPFPFYIFSGTSHINVYCKE